LLASASKRSDAAASNLEANMTELQPETRRFECVTCTRCGGTGHYSYCQMHGSTCFKCSGTGKQLTARGRAAAEWFRAHKRRKGSQIEFGAWVVMHGIPGFCATTYFTVDKIFTRLDSGSYLKDGVMVPSPPRLVLEGVTPKGERSGYETYPDADVDILISKRQKRELLTLAYDYQDTLTKTGKPRKR
jgi:hypothetical protein